MPLKNRGHCISPVLQAILIGESGFNERKECPSLTEASGKADRSDMTSTDFYSTNVDGPQPGYCLELGIEEYGKIFEIQQKLNQGRRNGVLPDTVILLEHHPCLTIGKRGGFDHILADDRILEREGIKVYQTDRGGDVTYHGPGQLVCYPILDLNGYGCDVHLYARRMEEALILTLNAFGIQAGRKADYPGVWVGDAKIGAEGIGVRHWVTMHGVSLNVRPNLRHFSFIVPCGISTLGITSMEEVLGHSIEMAPVKKELRRQLGRMFNLTLEDISSEKLMKRAGGMNVPYE